MLTGYVLLFVVSGKFIVKVIFGIYDFVTITIMSLKVSHILRIFGIKRYGDTLYLKCLLLYCFTYFFP